MSLNESIVEGAALDGSSFAMATADKPGSWATL